MRTATWEEFEGALWNAGLCMSLSDGVGLHGCTAARREGVQSLPHTGAEKEASSRGTG